MCSLLLPEGFYICVLILLYMCPHTTAYVSSYCYKCVLILLYMCPHTTIYVSSYYYICVLILLRILLHATVCVRVLLCKRCYASYCMCSYCKRCYASYCMCSYCKRCYACYCMCPRAAMQAPPTRQAVPGRALALKY